MPKRNRSDDKQILDKSRRTITFRGVCGGYHNVGWSQVLDETLEFFANVK